MFWAFLIYNNIFQNFEKVKSHAVDLWKLAFENEIILLSRNFSVNFDFKNSF